MLKIILCDDDPFFLSLESTVIKRIIKERKMNAAVSCIASSAAEICAFLENDHESCLVFLDIDFGENKPNGIDISSIIKNCKGTVRVVFCTNHYEMAMNVLKSGVEPFGFLEKGSDMARLSDGFARYISMALRLEGKNGGEGSYVTLSTGAGENVKIRIADILWIESEKGISHGITYHTVNGSNITVIGTLSSEAARLGEGFLRVHRSYLVQRCHMIAMHGGYIIMSDRSEIPCVLKMRREVRQWLDRK